MHPITLSRIPSQTVAWIEFIVKTIKKISCRSLPANFQLYLWRRNFEQTNSIKRIQTPYQGTSYGKDRTKGTTKGKGDASYKTCNTYSKEPVVSLRLNILIKLCLSNFMLFQKLLFTHRGRFNKARELIKKKSNYNIAGQKVIDSSPPRNIPEKCKNSCKQADKETLLKDIHLNFGFHDLALSQLILVNKKGEWK